MSSEYVVYNGELMHYGVPGMKWGVRKKAQYKNDKKVRRSIEYQAHDAGVWAKKYNKLYDRKSRSTNKKIDNDMRNRGYLSNKTQKAKRTTASLKTDRDYFNALNDATVKKLESHVNRMVKKYGNENVRSLKYNSDNGKKYVKTLLTRMANSNAIYTLIPYPTRDNDGNAVTRYQPTKTRYYHYVY